MDCEAFRQFLQSRQTPAGQVDAYIALAAEFEAFASHPAGPADLHAFSARLIAAQRNTWDNYLALLRYGRFVQNRPVLVAALELLDGFEAMETLHERLAQEAGPELRDRVFEGIALPPLGTPTTELPSVTRAVLERLDALVDPAITRRIFANCLRQLDREAFMPEREKYREAGSLDAYLDRKREEFVAQLEQIAHEGGLFFSQPITATVVDYVRSHPEIGRGIRVGNVLYETKIPYLTAEYLVATDPGMQRYHYCHCPWAKESLRAGETPVPATFCQCSAGFHKLRWEVIFDQPLRAEIVESVLQGDLRCTIAIHLPEGVA